MYRIIVAISLALAFIACAEEDSTAPLAPLSQPHDTVAALSPPPAGGSLPGYWRRRGATYEITPEGFVGVYGKTYTTDLRVDASRVWFDAREPGGGYREVFNGTASGTAVGDSVPGWTLLYSGNNRDGWTYRLAFECTYIRIQ